MTAVSSSYTTNSQTLRSQSKSGPNTMTPVVQAMIVTLKNIQSFYKDTAINSSNAEWNRRTKALFIPIESMINYTETDYKNNKQATIQNIPDVYKQIDIKDVIPCSKEKWQIIVVKKKIVDGTFPTTSSLVPIKASLNESQKELCEAIFKGFAYLFSSKDKEVTSKLATSSLMETLRQLNETDELHIDYNNVEGAKLYKSSVIMKHILDVVSFIPYSKSTDSKQLSWTNGKLKLIADSF